MATLVLGLVVFLGTHVLPAMPSLRTALISRFGEGPYKGLFSLVSAIGLVLIVWGYRQAPYVAVWEPPIWTRHLALLLMLPAAVFVVAAYVPGRIKAAPKHPFLAAVKIWAVAHLLANGDLASMLLFGSFLAYAVYDRVSVKGRQARGVVTVEARQGPARNDAIAVAAGLAVYAAVAFWLHPLLGPPVLP